MKPIFMKVTNTQYFSVGNSYAKFYPNFIKNREYMGEIHLCPYKKYALHCINHHASHICTTALCRDNLYRILSKLAQKCTKRWQNFIYTLQYSMLFCCTDFHKVTTALQHYRENSCIKFCPNQSTNIYITITHSFTCFSKV